MNAKQMTKLTEFVPAEYYGLWLMKHKIDPSKHPYTTSLYDENVKRIVPFSVSDFDLDRTFDGWTGALAFVTYRSHHSKQTVTFQFFF